MNKKNIYLALSLLIVSVIGLLLWSKFSADNHQVALSTSEPTPVPPSTQPTTTTPTSSLSTTASEIELDLSKLQGKDRLYTEEEGKWDNLSEEERRLLEKVYRELCNSYTYSFCSWSVFSAKNQSRLITLKDSQALIYFPDKKASTSDPAFGLESFHGEVVLYNIETNEDGRVSSGGERQITMGSEYIIKLGFSGYDGSTMLQIYRPGMEEFANIMPSVLPDSLDLSPYAPSPVMSYVELSSECHMGGFPIEFNEGEFTVYLHAYDIEVTESTDTKKTCKLLSKYPAIFDLERIDIVPLYLMRNYRGAKALNPSLEL